MSETVAGAIRYKLIPCRLAVGLAKSSISNIDNRESW